MAGYPSMTMGAQGQGVTTMGAGQAAFNSSVGGMMAPQQAIAQGAASMGNNATNMWSAQNSAYQQAQQNDAAGLGALGSAAGQVAGAFII